MAKTMTMPDSPPTEEGPSGLEIKIEHKVLPSSHFCNHMMIQGDDECLYLHFFEIRPPVILASMVEQERPTSVVAEPIVCLAVSLAKVERFVEVMGEQVKRFKERKHANSDT